MSGVGRLIAEANICPLVIPMFHMGMDTVLPNTEPYVPQMNQKLSICVGQPLIFDELVQKMKNENYSLVSSTDNMHRLIVNYSLARNS